MASLYIQRIDDELAEIVHLACKARAFDDLKEKLDNLETIAKIVKRELGGVKEFSEAQTVEREIDAATEKEKAERERIRKFMTLADGIVLKRYRSEHETVFIAGTPHHIYAIKVAQDGDGEWKAGFFIDTFQLSRFYLTAPSRNRAEKCAVSAAHRYMIETRRRSKGGQEGKYA